MRKDYWDDPYLYNTIKTVTNTDEDSTVYPIFRRLYGSAWKISDIERLKYLNGLNDSSRRRT